MHESELSNHKAHTEYLYAREKTDDLLKIIANEIDGIVHYTHILTRLKLYKHTLSFWLICMFTKVALYQYKL